MASTPSWPFVVCVALAVPATPACTLDTFGASGAGSGPTASSSPTTVSAGNTAEATTPATTGVDASTTSDDPSTTGVDASATSDAPSTTSVDPSTTTGGASSTTIDDDMTGVTSMTTTTTNETTGGPPSKDPQPVAGLYEACLDNIPCDPSTDGCFTLTDVNMIVTDGFCTLFCNSVVDCGTKPQCPAVQECLNIAVGQNVCALKCADVKDCPTGMACTDIALPMGQSGTYCF